MNTATTFRRRFSAQAIFAMTGLLQESLTDVARHSGASRVSVRVAVNAAALEFEVSDSSQS